MPTAAAILAPAVIGGAASIFAGKSQNKQTNKGIAATNELLGPYSKAGAAGLPAVQSFVDSGSEVNFRDTQAYKDITNSSKAGGGRYSGNRDTALGDYLMTNFRPQRLNELLALPTIGANASAQQATSLNNLYDSKGATSAGSILGAANAANNAFGQYAFLSSYLNRGE